MDASQAERIRHDEELETENEERQFRLTHNRHRAPDIDVVKPFKVVRIPLTFDTPDLSAPNDGFSMYIPVDGDKLVGSWMWLPDTSWDGSTPELAVGTEGDSSSLFEGALGEVGIIFSNDYHPLDGSPILALVHDGELDSPGSTMGEGEFGMLILPAGVNAL